jgi:hypothetical protein
MPDSGLTVYRKKKNLPPVEKKAASKVLAEQNAVPTLYGQEGTIYIYISNLVRFGLPVDSYQTGAAPKKSDVHASAPADLTMIESDGGASHLESWTQSHRHTEQYTCIPNQGSGMYHGRPPDCHASKLDDT